MTTLHGIPKGSWFYKGDVIPNTHIHDLVQDVLRKCKTHVPVGWQTFARVLRESNIPQVFSQQSRSMAMDESRRRNTNGSHSISH